MNEKLYAEIFKLKNVIRNGWKIRDVQGRLESDAEHTFSMIMLSLEIIKKNKLDLDQLKVIKMIAYHELGEIDVGDITPFDNIPKQQKYDDEYKCIKRLSTTYNMPEIEELWLEFERCETKEARFVKKIDRYDAIMQAKMYETNNQAIKGLLNEFRNGSIAIAEEFDEYLNEK